jgi:hypothetical protein
MNLIFTADIGAPKSADRYKNMKGLFGVFNRQDEPKGFWSTKKEAEEWLNSWVFNNTDT